MLFPLILYYHRLNCYSLNALAGAIDVDPGLANLHVDIALNAEQLHRLASTNLMTSEKAIIALSLLTCQIEETRGIVQRLRSDFGPRVIIVAGGPHATACPDEVAAMGIDFVVKGEAESTFPALLRAIAEEREIRETHIRGTRVDINAFPSFSPGRGMFGPIEITRGCAFACSYCQTSHIFGVNLRHRTVGNIVRQAEALRSVSRRVVRLLSPNAFSYGSPDGRILNIGAMHELLSSLRGNLGLEAKIIFGHFPSEVRPEHVTPETLDLLKEFADNDEIVIGAQSGSQRVLDACHRSHDVESVLTAVSTARRYGYKLIVDFIFGLPDETESDLDQTLKVMDEVVGLGARIHPHIFAPLPQTAYSKKNPGSLSPRVMAALDATRSRRGLYEN